MEYIRVTQENIESEHICCASSNNKDIQVFSKKEWLRNRFDDGLVFLKSVERGKCFIEYIPAVNAWVPLNADGYMYIDCLWVSGSFKGHGYSNDLLEECVRDSKEKGMFGLCVLSSAKKRGFLSDPKHLSHKGFKVADEADNGIQLWYLPFEENAPVPQFKECARHPWVEGDDFVVLYTHQCPFNAKYVPIVEEYAKGKGIPFRSVLISTKEEAQNAPTPVTTYAVFRDGRYVTNEVLNEKKLDTLVEN
ncbi:MAG: YoaP domain-containing protein [Oscillospiraceae bacterium]|nr:YoaP domain-containing protein [Oscillospiraceae bacterium]